MQAQYLRYVQERSEREALPPKQVEGIAIVTVARGDGLEKLFDEYGAARIIVGGQTMNPSTEDFLSAIESLSNDEIILLPNNGNVIMAAQQAAALAVDKKVRVVSSKTVQQGIAALIAYMDSEGSLQEVQETMTEALSTVISGEVTTATRNVSFDGVDVQEGEYIGLINGKLVVSNTELKQVVFDLLDNAGASSYELLTIYYGEGLAEKDAEILIDQLEDLYPELEFEAVYGGQPLYPYLFSIE
jgi:dihydroxyacetone kinase-like predicted kinase